MQATSPLRDPRDLEMLQAMNECGFALAMAAGEMAKRAGNNTALFLKATDAFHRCSFVVRMGVRLKHWGVGAPRAASAQASLEVEKPERPERPERPDSTGARERSETEREGVYEPVSLPRFLKTLGLAAASAERNPDVFPPQIRDTTLPTLKALLKQAKASPEGAGPTAGAAQNPAGFRNPAGIRNPASAVAVLARPPAARAARARLLASTVTPGVPPRPPSAPRRRPSG